MKILYFSSVNWKWIKQRPHFISKGLSDLGYDVDYISMTPLFKQKIGDNRKIDKLKIKDIYSIPLNDSISFIRKLNKYILFKKIQIDKYDTIILTHPNQYFFWKINYLKIKN